MAAPTYPSSAIVADAQPTGYRIFNKLRSDALYAGAGQVEPADVIQSVTLGAMLDRYIRSVRPEYLATNRIRIPHNSIRPPALVINGYMLKATTNVDLPASQFSGVAARWYIFANRAAGSTTFTLTVNTSATEAADQRRIGEVYWDGTDLDQGSPKAEELDSPVYFQIGIDIQKSTSPNQGDGYFATDYKIFWFCFTAGIWSSVSSKLFAHSGILAINNTIAETSLYSYTVQPNTLGTNAIIELRIGCSVYFAAASQQITIRVKYGATTMITATHVVSVAAGTYYAELVVILKGNTSPNAQQALLIIQPAPRNATITGYPGGEGTATEDSTLSKELEITVQPGVAAAGLGVTKQTAIVQLYNP